MLSPARLQNSACAVVDWNPSGLNIFSVYKHGSPDRGAAHCLPRLMWLAARAEMLHGVPDDALQVHLIIATRVTAEPFRPVRPGTCTSFVMPTSVKCAAKPSQIGVRVRIHQEKGGVGLT